MADATLRIKSVVDSTQAIQALGKEQHAFKALSKEQIDSFNAIAKGKNNVASAFAGIGQALKAEQKAHQQFVNQWLRDQAKIEKHEKEKKERRDRGFLAASSVSSARDELLTGLTGGLLGGVFIEMAKSAFEGIAGIIEHAIKAADEDRIIQEQIHDDLGEGVGNYVSNLAKQIGEHSAVSDAQAASFILPIADSIKNIIHRGSQVLDKNGRVHTIKTDAEAEKVQENLIGGFGHLLSDAIVVAKSRGSSPQEASQALLRFASDPNTGLKQFASAFGVQGRKAEIEALVKANQSGTLAKALGPDAAKYGVKNGQVVGGNKLLEIVFDRLHLNNAAKSIRTTFEYQIDQIKAIAENQFGEIGKLIIDSLGGTEAFSHFADNVKAWVNSPEGHAFIHDFAESLGTAAKIAVDLIKDIPMIMEGLSGAFDWFIDLFNLGDKAQMKSIENLNGVDRYQLATRTPGVSKADILTGIYSNSDKLKMYKELQKEQGFNADAQAERNSLTSQGPLRAYAQDIMTAPLAQYDNSDANKRAFTIQANVNIAAKEHLTDDELRARLHAQAPDLIDAIMAEYHKKKPN